MISGGRRCNNKRCVCVASRRPQIGNAYFKGDGTPGSGGVDIGGVPVRLAVTPLQGMRRDARTGALTKVWVSVSHKDMVSLPTRK